MGPPSRLAGARRGPRPPTHGGTVAHRPRGRRPAGPRDVAVDRPRRSEPGQRRAPGAADVHPGLNDDCPRELAGPGGWRVIGPLPMVVKGPGCYGLQIDTTRGS